MGRSDPVRLAIVTGEYVKPGQTFINRHIRELFGGNSVVVHAHNLDPDPWNKRRFCLADHRPGFPALLPGLGGSLGETMENLRRFGTLRAPVGRTRQALETFLATEKVTAILAEQGQFAPMILPVAQRMNLPLFVYFRGMDAVGYLTSAGRGTRRLKAYRAVFEHAAGVFAVSQFLLDALAAHGLRHPSSHVVPSGVDTARFAPGAKTPGLVLGVGRFIAKKAPEVTIRAFLQAAEGIDHARLEMIGDGPLLKRAKALAQSLDPKGRIRFLGRQPHEVVRERLARCDIYAQHSVRAPNGDVEGAPSAIQEAMACGAAIVATRHAGIPDLVDEDQNGLLCDEFDLAGYSAHLRRLLLEPETARRFGAEGRRKAAREFDVAKLYARVEEVIAQAAHAGQAPRRPAAAGG